MRREYDNAHGARAKHNSFKSPLLGSAPSSMVTHMRCNCICAGHPATHMSGAAQQPNAEKRGFVPRSSNWLIAMRWAPGARVFDCKQR